MSKTKLIIVEDEFFAANHLKALVNSLGYFVTAIYHSGEDFLKSTDWRFDVAIVDIFLAKKLTGIDVAKHLVKHKKPFIFLTANQDSTTVKNATHLNPTAYLSKPFNDNDVMAALEIVSHSLSPKIKVRGKSGIKSISVDEIMFVKGDGAYIEIHTIDELISQRKLLKDFAEEVGENFIRVHRSYLVNKKFIDEKSSSELIIKGESIPISRNYKD